MSKIDNENAKNIISNADSNGKEERNVPDLRFKEDKQWTAKKLDEIASLYKGNGLSKEDISPEGNYCILYGQLYTTYTSEIIDNIVSKTKKIPINAFYSLSNDIIIPASGETPEDIAKACCITSNGILIGGDLNVIRNYNHNGGFLCYQLNGKRKYEIARLAQGKSIVHLHNSDIKNIKIYYPLNKNIEVKICNFLYKIDVRIQTQKKIIDNYKSLIKVINNKHFSDITPNYKFHVLYKKAKEGGTPDTKNSRFHNNGDIPFIKIDDLNNKYLISNNSFITDEGLKNSSAWIIPENSILFSNGATIGSVSINKYPVSTKQGILGIVPNDTIISSEYMYYLIKSKFFKKEIKKITTKGTMEAAYIQDINSVICPIENIDKQKVYTTNMNIIYSKIDNEKKTLSLLEKQKQYLLNKLFI